MALYSGGIDMMTPKSFSIRTLHVSAECAPLAKAGGLADVAGSLPKALVGLDIDARVLMPAWPGVIERAANMGYLNRERLGQISVAIDWRAWTADVYEAVVGGTHIYLLEQPELFSNQYLYPERINETTALPFVFLSYAPFELPAVTGWKPQFLHSHDWTSALVPAALRWHKYYSKFNGEYDTVFTIHNLAHQGLFSQDVIAGWGLSEECFSPLDTDSMEFYGQLNLMKGAIISAEALTTVSPSYSWDIQTQSGGFGLDGVVLEHKNKLRGIINGLDYDVWNPAGDKLISAAFSQSDMRGKEACKNALAKEAGFEDPSLPTVIFVGRLTEQKGIDIMLDAAKRFLPYDINFVIIGSGNEMYNRKVTEFAASYPKSVYAITRFSEKTAHMAYAGGDILLMPSLFEPCGLSQLIAFAYGTIPVARATGGLADTVIDADGSADGNGFLFTDYSIEELSTALARALGAKRDRERWKCIVKNAMTKDFSWDSSAKEYTKLYNDILTSD